MNSEMIFAVVLVLGLVAIPIVPPLLVLRGRRFWAPWTMLGAVVLFALTLVSNIGVQFYLGKRMREVTAIGGAAIYESPEWERILELMQLAAVVFGGLVVLSLIVYAAGLLGVACRWKETSRRARELEAKTAELARLRETGSP
ncbi:MAG: hypothetical protein ACSHYB_08945 [Roseibacillus sp.]